MNFNNISFILHKPQLSENIGLCARAMIEEKSIRVKGMRKFNSCSSNGALAGKGQGYNTYNADKCTLFIPIFIDFREVLKTWTEIYIYETDRLALHLYVPNYRNPAQARYRFNREGAEFIQALPGPADVAVGTRLLLEVSHR